MVISLPDNYSNADFKAMQEQAIRRAREMQQKAQNQGQNHNQNHNHNQDEAQKNRPDNQQRRQDNRRPLERPNIYQARSQKQDSQKKQPKEQQPKKPNTSENREKSEGKSNNPLSSLLNLDGDMSLILPLILFLGKEGADDTLILALLYIMS